MGFLGIKFPDGFTPIPEVVGNELLMLYSPTTGKIHQSELGLLSFGVDEQAVIDLVNTNTSVNVYNAARLGGELPNYYAPASSLTNYYTKAQTDSLLSGKFDKAGGSITGNVSIGGNLTVLGTEFIADVQTVQIKDNLAVINYGETGAGVTAGFSGWEIDRGTATHYRFGFTESVGYFQVGKIGSLQTVATREDVPLSNGFARWNATLKRFDTVVINNIVTGTGAAGQISYWNGTGSQAGSANFIWDNNLKVRGVAAIRFERTTSGFTGIEWWGTDPNQTAFKAAIRNIDSASFRRTGIGFYTSDIADWTTEAELRMSILRNGNVLIGTTTDSGYKMDVNGGIRAAGNIYATGNITGAGEVTAYTASDKRLKTNINKFGNALSIIDKLTPVTYNWNAKAVELNGNKDMTGVNYGLIAQELEQIVPDLIRPIYGDYKTYDDRGLMAIMLQAIKELKSKVDKLENKN